MNGDERHRRIAEAAYFRAEQRGFPIGTELEDWLEAERAIDATLVERQGEACSAAKRGGPNGVGKESIAAPST